MSMKKKSQPRALPEEEQAQETHYVTGDPIPHTLSVLVWC